MSVDIKSNENKHTIYVGLEYKASDNAAPIVYIKHDSLVKYININKKKTNLPAYIAHTWSIFFRVPLNGQYYLCAFNTRQSWKNRYDERTKNIPKYCSLNITCAKKKIFSILLFTICNIFYFFRSNLLLSCFAILVMTFKSICYFPCNQKKKERKNEKVLFLQIKLHDVHIQTSGTEAITYCSWWSLFNILKVVWIVNINTRMIIDSDNWVKQQMQIAKSNLTSKDRWFCVDCFSNSISILYSTILIFEFWSFCVIFV